MPLPERMPSYAELPIRPGLPAGSGLEFADEITLSRALEGRREFD